MASIPLYRQIQEDIKAQIANAELRVGDRIPSESELMSRYFVSSITVKNALNGLVDEGVIYRMQGKGSFVSASPFPNTPVAEDSQRPVIAVVFPTMATRVEQLYLIHLERECRAFNWRLMVGISRESVAQEIQLVQDFIQCGAKGLMLFPTVSEHQNALVRQLVARRFPLVMVDRFLEGTAAPCVVSDNMGGAHIGTKYLIDQCGSRVAICHFPMSNMAVAGRLEGFRKAMKEAGHPMTAANQCIIEDSDLVFASSDRRVALLYETLIGHMRRHPHIDGLFTANTEIGQVAWLVMTDLGRMPGVDVHMVSFDNPHRPGVNFIQQDYGAIISKCAQALNSQIEGNVEKSIHTVPIDFVHVPHKPRDIRDMRHLVTGLNP